jgi:hypothetical protein
MSTERRVSNSLFFFILLRSFHFKNNFLLKRVINLLNYLIMFSETKTIKDFCLEIGSVDESGTPQYALREHPTKKDDAGKPVRHILFFDGAGTKAMCSKNLTPESLANSAEIQVSWFESPTGDTEGYMVHGVGAQVEYTTTVFKIS